MNVVSFGGGTNSTAMIIRNVPAQNPDRPDLIRLTPVENSRTRMSSLRPSTAGWKSMVFRRSPLYSTTTKTATA